MRVPCSAARCALAVTFLLATHSALAQEQSQRLSTWVLRNAKADSYFAGLSWQVPGEVPAQAALKRELLQELDSHAGPPALRQWLSSLPVTGRVPVVFVDPRWLMAHPTRDPVLLPGDSVALPPRPSTVTVIAPSGERCTVRHAAGREAMAYVEVCSPTAPAPVDWVWLVQPDGRAQRFGVASWNRETQDEPAPGAWIWAPSREQRYPDGFSDRLARFLATQGPAADPHEAAVAAAPSSAAFSARSRSASYYSNDWGETGLLQTPSARIRPAGTFTFHLSHVWPYTRGNVFVSPFDWMEAGFRYTDIANRPYGPSNVSGDQSYKDKSFDVKLRLVTESAYVPQLAVGIRDLAGTGLFSGEYVVANKRFGAFDWSAGLGWGYVAGRGNLRNPLSALSSRFDAREVDFGQGGSFSTGSYFHGPTALFGGLQYQTPWESLVLRIERDGNDYQHEPRANALEPNNLPQRTPWNFGLTYRLSSSVQLTAGVERGNRLLLGLALTGNAAEAYTPKLSDPPRIPYSRPAAREPDWQATANEVARQTGWRVRGIEQSMNEWRVTVLDAEGIYWAERADRAAAVLNRDAPSSIERFVLIYRQRGIDMAQHTIDRRTWAAKETRPIVPHERGDTIVARPADGAPNATVLTTKARPRLEHGLGPDLQYNLGGPDAFALYQIGIAERLRFWFTDDTWLRGKFRLGLTNNYDRYKTTGPSDLPRVRTYLREYQTTSRFTMNHMQATHAGRITDNQYFSLYGGYFEEMFGGVGSEWLYRPFASRTAFGVDVNYARQRDFDQDLGFMEYHVITGHATLYVDTGWRDVLATISAGRYLAGDTGATVQLTRVFSNGVTMGAFATKTNVSAQRFGEGSFDKGVFLTIPFDAIFTRSSSTSAQLLWKPLTRDGGAKLFRQDPLYTVSSVRDYRTLWYKPAKPTDQFSITP